MKKILVFYKKSAFQRSGKGFLKKVAVHEGQLLKRETNLLQVAHDEHKATLEYLKSRLKRNNVPFEAKYRGQKIDFKKYSIILTVGGDGTFLEAARYVSKHLLIGINSSLSSSVGYL
ncbi:MAG: NAD(+)/NADH kinase, partial [Candidatus Omnitrophica bacterium]|nr:NAD(+)/NADH kinase [Candidatus Omnitrophota bacterium]